MATYEGRLELTWTNKHLRLLAHDDGSYEWIPPPDYRVAEVRLLHDTAQVGEVGINRAAGHSCGNALLVRENVGADIHLSRQGGHHRGSEF
mgnify:CR=1 FL=1